MMQGIEILAVIDYGNQLYGIARGPTISIGYHREGIYGDNLLCPTGPCLVLDQHSTSMNRAVYVKQCAREYEPDLGGGGGGGGGDGEW